MGRRRRNSPAMTLFAFQDVIMSVSGIMIVIVLLLTLELVNRNDSPSETSTARLAEEIKAQVRRTRQDVAHLEAELQQADQLMATAGDTTPEMLRRSIAEAAEWAEELEAEAAEATRRIEMLDEERKRLAVGQFELKAMKDKLDRTLSAIWSIETELSDKSKRPVFTIPNGSRRSGWLAVISENRIDVAQLERSMRPLTFTSDSGLLGKGADEKFVDWANSLGAGNAFVYLLIRPRGISLFDEVRDGLERHAIQYGFDVVPANLKLLHPERGAAE